MSTIEEKSIYDIQLYHKPRKPVRTKSSDAAEIGKKIIEKSHLTDNTHHVVIMWSIYNSVKRRKSHEANHYHTERFYPMTFNKTKDWKT